MIREDKQLVLQDLCGRLPYGVKIELTWWVMGEGTYINTTLEPDHIAQLLNDEDGDIEIKPYLRPMSSMTEEEQKILEDFGVTISPFLGQMHIPFDEIEFPFITMQKIISYLYSIHIDINGLIPKGLAIEVTENNNPYKD